ncbi:MAG: MerR family transcriptional regulator [Crocinitomicaceae bacterium]|nr:MerR family transcriptional regulator [Crocinitomicaceae bacterium]
MGNYKIKDLEQLSGIKAHTIRIWERRYNLISPDRTDTNIRLYSDKDLKNLLLVAILNKNGHKISKIVEMPKEERIQLLEDNLHVRGEQDAIFDILILSMIELDEEKFSSELEYLFDTFGVLDTFIKYLFPFVERIGIMWKVGSITPVQEHFITNLIRQKLVSRIDQLKIPNKNHRKILIYLPEHELHEISVLLYNYIIRSTGKYTYYLGQTVPLNDLIKAIDQVQPDAIVTSFITRINKSHIISHLKSIQTKPKHKTSIYAGGFQIDSLADDELPTGVKKILSTGILLDI